MPTDAGALPFLAINLEHGDTDHETCGRLPFDLYAELTAPNIDHPGYGEFEVNISVLVVPDDIEADWFDTRPARWMRKKIRRARELGYEFAPFDFNDYIDDIYEINTSKRERQGRWMSELFGRRPSPEPRISHHPCPRHQKGWFGVFRNGKLYAYLFVIQAGEALFTPRILGHGDYLEDGIMAFALFETVRWHHDRGRPSYVYYHLHEGISAGLLFFKEKMGFAGHVVRWDLSRRSAGAAPTPMAA